MTKQKEYDGSKIKVLKGIQGIRTRANMYIGDTDTHAGIFTILREITDNAIDEFMEGHGNIVEIILLADGSIRVRDEGRGVPVDIHPTEGISTALVIYTQLHSGGKFDKDSYAYSSGLNGVGATATNACSKFFEFQIRKDGGLWVGRFERGELVQDVEKIKSIPKSSKTGTQITFCPDPEIFKVVEYDYDILAEYYRQTAFLNPGLKITLTDNRNNVTKSEEFFSENGFDEFIRYLDRNKQSIIRSPIAIKGEKDNVKVDCSLQWNDTDETIEKCFTNNILQIDGGTHQTGFRSGLSRAMLKYIADVSKKDVVADDIREGLTAVISVKVPDPKFSSQTKDKLVNAEIRNIVESIVYEQISDWLVKNQRHAKAIAAKVVLNATARTKAKQAKDLVKKANDAFESTTKTPLPGKLADCQLKDPNKIELFIVEGDSAGGSAKQGRDRKFQAILPLKGKILNVEKATLAKILDNEEVTNLITALGTGYGKNFDINKLRYHKICLLADADVDGSHIQTLLMTFFYRQMPEIILNGHLYIAQPPLYKVKVKGKDVYLKNDAALNEYKKRNSGMEFSRFKGLGEMNPAQLWDTTLNPETRDLLQVKIDNLEEAEEYFSNLMGDLVAPRKKFIYDNALNANTDI